jgi:hypothetical protein
MSVDYIVGTNSRFSSHPERINDLLETELVETEACFSEFGRIPVVSVISGGLRFCFGCVEMVASLALAFFKFCEAIYTYVSYGPDEARLPLLESAYALTYFIHGIGNLVRGCLEIVQMMAIADQFFEQENTEHFPHPLLYNVESSKTLPEREDDLDLIDLECFGDEDEEDLEEIARRNFFMSQQQFFYFPDYFNETGEPPVFLFG